MRTPTIFSALLACAIAAVACGGGAKPRQAATLGPLRVSHPASFDRRYPSCKYTTTYTIPGGWGLCVGGVVVASFALGPQPEVPSAVASPSGVAFRLYRAPGPKPVVVAPAVRFPLSLADFSPRCGLPGEPCPPAQQNKLFFRVKGRNYWAIAWIGPDSSKRLRAALDSIISSLRVE